MDLLERLINAGTYLLWGIGLTLAGVVVVINLPIFFTYATVRGFLDPSY